MALTICATLLRAAVAFFKHPASFKRSGAKLG
jgi:hypothetical protein